MGEKGVKRLMYLHLGQEVVVKYRDIIGIFDLEKATLSKKTKDFLSRATKEDGLSPFPMKCRSPLSSSCRKTDSLYIFRRFQPQRSENGRQRDDKTLLLFFGSCDLVRNTAI